MARSCALFLNAGEIGSDFAGSGNDGDDFHLHLDLTISGATWIRVVRRGTDFANALDRAGQAFIDIGVEQRDARAAACLFSVAFDPAMANRQVLALYERTPNLQGMLVQIADTLKVKAPRRHVPIGLLRSILTIPGLATRLAISAESLNFIQTQRFDMGNSRQLERKYAFTHPDMTQALENTVRYVSDYLMKKSKREAAGQRG